MTVADNCGGLQCNVAVLDVFFVTFILVVVGGGGFGYGCRF